MAAAVKAYLTASIALVAAGVISATPVAAPPVNGAAASVAYRLTAASSALTASSASQSEPSLTNVAVNLLNMVLSMPAWELRAMDRLADAMIATGSWQAWGPTNVIGFDEQDPPKFQALIDMLIPIEPFSSVLGDQLSWWARANLPMNAGCAAQPGACPDRNAVQKGNFTVPLSQLHEGYQFPTVTNPFTGEPTSWSGRYVKLGGDPSAALWAYLTAPPTGVATVSPGGFPGTLAKLGKSFYDAFNPFVQNSEWFNDDQTGLAPLFRALAPTLCPSCDPDEPYNNPWLNENYSPNRSVSAAAAVTASTARAAGGAGNSETAAPVSSAVNAMVDKPDFAGKTEETAEPAAESAAAGLARTVTGAVGAVGKPGETARAGREVGTPLRPPHGQRKSADDLNSAGRIPHPAGAPEGPDRQLDMGRATPR